MSDQKLNWDEIDACLFDLDGVLTPTAELHMQAWHDLFAPFLAEHHKADYQQSDYFDHLDGRPRYEGVKALLDDRGIELPWGDPSDSDDAQTVCGLGNRKDAVFARLLSEEGIKPYPGSLTLLDALAGGPIRLAVVSSSKNARGVLEQAGIIDRFGVIVDGTVAGEQGLPGKPAPDTFEYAADQLGVPHGRSVVFEDALSGVRAGAAGDFHTVVGVDRGTGADRLRAAGADVVVSDLSELLDHSGAPDHQNQDQQNQDQQNQDQQR